MTEEKVTTEKNSAEKRKFRLSFSRNQLCIPYGLFLAVFVVIPLLLIVFYAFTDKGGGFSFSNFGVKYEVFFVLVRSNDKLVVVAFVNH